MSNSTQMALYSIHDVMPSTLQQTGELIELCRRSGVETITLLVVPGRKWSSGDIEQLRRWSEQGCELAGHGWKHECDSISGLKHRLHSAFLSRTVAEHLSQSPSEIFHCIRRCGAWFVTYGFKMPFLYVPPAWALGSIGNDALSTLPFRMIETLSGVCWTADCTTRSLPLIGFEADNALRSAALKAWNRFVIWDARLGRQPLRVSIHPHDLNLHLKDDLKRALALPMLAVSYASIECTSAKSQSAAGRAA